MLGWVPDSGGRVGGGLMDMLCAPSRHRTVTSAAAATWTIASATNSALGVRVRPQSTGANIATEDGNVEFFVEKSQDHRKHLRVHKSF